MTARKKKALLIFPLIFIPLMALVFYALGGGQQSSETTEKGINVTLPEAEIPSDTQRDKRSLYAQKPREEKAEDPEKLAEAILLNPDGDLEQRAVEIQEKIALLEARLQAPDPQPESVMSARTPVKGFPGEHASFGDDVDRLEALMQGMQEAPPADPETLELNAMMENILDLQHPQRVINREQAGRDSLKQDSAFKAVPAFIAEKQKVLHGGTVALTLSDTLEIKDYVIPKGHQIFGIARLMNQRIRIEIRHIRLGTSIIPVNAVVYGLDGIEGLEAPEAILRETAGMGADRMVSGISMYNSDPSLGSQLAGAGMQAARQAIRRKVRKVKVRLKAGQPVLLRMKR